MKIDPRWRNLGWKHPLWSYVRFAHSLRRRTKAREEWFEKLGRSIFEVQPGINLTIPPADLDLFRVYMDERDQCFADAFTLLRTKDDALRYCADLKIQVEVTRSKHAEWSPSPKAMVAAATNIARLVCAEKGIALIEKPQRRCIWLRGNEIHVSARNLDGAIPALYAPVLVWEIKDYWGGGAGKDGGSKMSDAVYECNLVGRELREFEDRTGHPPVHHIVFLDGQGQWRARDSDLKRFIDLFHQGIIDHLFIGREVETDWEPTLRSLLDRGSSRDRK